MAGPALAAGLTLDFGAVDAGGLAAAGGRITLRPAAPGEFRAEVVASAPRVPGLAPIAALRAACPRLVADAGGWWCPRAKLRVEFAAPAPALQIEAQVRLAPGGDVTLEIPPAPVAGGRLSLEARRTGGAWTGRLRVVDAALADLRAMVDPGLPGGVVVSAGRADLDGTVEPGGAARVRLGFRGVAFSDDAGLRAGEGLAGELHASLGPGAAEAAFELRARASSGEVYAAPVFLDLAATPVAAEAAGTWSPGARRLALSSLALEHSGVARVTGSAVIGPGGIRGLDLSLAPTDAAALFDTYARPALAGGALDGAEAAGTVAANLAWRDGAPASLEVGLSGVDLVGAGRRLDLRGLGGRLRWDAAGEGEESVLSYDSGRVYRLPLGPARIRFRASGDRVTLTRPATVPVLDGGLRIESLVLSGLDARAPRVEFSGGLEPLSLGRLTEALGWPRFEGAISGEAPGVHYRDRTVSVDGALRVQVFDGEVALEGLRLEDPLGVVPRLYTDVRIRDLSLDELTRTFSFGRIQGRLEGRARGLVLEDWTPSAFDAVLRTPDADRSTHRISQRAVDNLASIGGAGGALSGTFLRLFESFSYGRLGLRCRLRQGVCRMGGVAPVAGDGGGGYYIVQGGGLPPRIDVVGYNREVDWSGLVERLRAITASEGPVVR